MPDGLPSNDLEYSKGEKPECVSQGAGAVFGEVSDTVSGCSFLSW